MILPEHNEAFEKFVNTVKGNSVLSPETTTLIFLGAAMAIRCHPCAERFIAQAKDLGLSDEQMGTAAAIAMCVRAGSTRAMAMEIAGMEP
ncbi:MAG: carboxymuconolactone decarboxylase family protein [Deltaproteobacteria bacterium]|nr:carboxymuconolactone decarboxylase family protein [Deltaproteobacteria bacterium]